MSHTECLAIGLSKSARVGWIATAGLMAALAATIFASPNWRNSAAVGQVVPMSGWISVRILTPDGKAAKGFAGIVFDGKSRESELVETQINNGQISVDLSLHAGYPRATLVAFERGYGLTFKRVWPVEHPVEELHLAKETTLTGIIKTPGLKPAAGVVVVPKLLTMGDWGASSMEFLMVPKDLQQLFSSGTDSSGRFHMPGLPAGANVDIEVEDPKFASLGTYDNRTGLSSGPQTTVGTIVMHSASAFEGRVTQNGKAVAGVHIGAQANQNPQHVPNKGLWGEAVTDSNGRFHMGKLQAGAYNVIADVQDDFDSGFTAVAHEDVSLSEGQIKTGIDFELILGAIVKGKVTGPDGLPVAGVGIGIYGPAHPQSSAWVQTAFTGPDGRYQLRVPGGKQYVYLYSAPARADDQTITVQNGKSTSVDFQMK